MKTVVTGVLCGVAGLIAGFIGGCLVAAEIETYIPEIDDEDIDDEDEAIFEDYFGD